MSLAMKGMRKAFDGSPLFEDFSLDLEAGKVSVLLGPSGSGKTTLLNIFAGIVEPDGGEVLVFGRPAREAKVSYLFQEPRLLPWKTVRRNLDFVLPPETPKGERNRRIDEVLKTVSLAGAAGKYPAELSGGMARRAAMARAFLFEAEALLMDEPFTGLDLPLKMGLLRSFEAARAAESLTTLFVTHDMEEALLLGDVLYVLSPPPAQVRLRLENPVPRSERSPGHEAFSSLERDLYKALGG